MLLGDLMSLGYDYSQVKKVGRNQQQHLQGGWVSPRFWATSCPQAMTTSRSNRWVGTSSSICGGGVGVSTLLGNLVSSGHDDSQV
jgi:hypothetical protein